jgi:hypothetical protein
MVKKPKNIYKKENYGSFNEVQTFLGLGVSRCLTCVSVRHRHTLTLMITLKYVIFLYYNRCRRVSVRVCAS